jgi:CBS domain-containing protein
MASASSRSGLSPFTHSIAELVKGDVRVIAPERPVVEAARRMSDERVGSLVVLEGARPVGILTKTDLVQRVLAREAGPALTVGDVLTRELVTVQQHQSIFDGLLLMIRHGIGHLLVMDNGRLVGIVSERDWLTFQERHPAALLRDLESAPSIAELARLRGKSNRLVRELFGDEGTAEALTRFVTEINDRVGRRVIALCLAGQQASQGAPPVAFAWIAMGSEGRSEQTLSTDQDNGLIFADVPDADTQRVQAWFLGLAGRVVEGLAACGFPRCKGNVMASNPALCQPLAAWQRRFAGYLQAADPESLLRASIYFDFRCLAGEPGLVDALRTDLRGRMRTQKGFLRHLVAEALQGRPPVGNLGWRVRSALRLPHPPLDLKRNALAPLVAAARVLALAADVPQTNTLERLRGAQAAELLPAGLARAAQSAYDFLMLLRIRQNFAQQAQGQAPSNELLLEELNPLQRRFLVEALQTVIDLQDHVQERFVGITVP